MTEFIHKSVLLNECIEGLSIKPDGIYVDGTLGGGGHSAAAGCTVRGLPHADAGIITKLLRKNRRAASPAVRRSEKAWGMAGPWAESDSLSSAVS